MQGVWVRSLVVKLRPHMLLSVVQQKKKKKTTEVTKLTPTPNWP